MKCWQHSQGFLNPRSWKCFQFNTIRHLLLDCLCVIIPVSTRCLKDGKYVWQAWRFWSEWKCFEGCRKAACHGQRQEVKLKKYILKCMFIHIQVNPIVYIFSKDTLIQQFYTTLISEFWGKRCNHFRNRVGSRLSESYETLVRHSGDEAAESVDMEIFLAMTPPALSLQALIYA